MGKNRTKRSKHFMDESARPMFTQVRRPLPPAGGAHKTTPKKRHWDYRDDLDESSED